LVGSCIGKNLVLWLIEHFVCQEAEIEQIKDKSKKRQSGTHAQFCFPVAKTKIMENWKSNQEQANDPKVDDVVVNKIGQANRFRTLASWKRHDEVDAKNLDPDEKNNPGDEEYNSCHGVSAFVIYEEKLILP
jgi:hypothetical protein